MTLWLTGYSWVASYMLVWFIVILARHLQCNNCYWHSCVWGHWYPIVCCVSRLLTTSIDQWDVPLAATVVFTVNCRVYIAFCVFSTTSELQG